MPTATFEVFFREATKQGNHITPRKVIAIDIRNDPDTPPGFTSLGVFDHPTHDRSIAVRHKLRNFLGQFGLFDMASIDVEFEYFERAVFYNLPEELTVELDKPTQLLLEIHPQNATNSVPSFEVEDGTIISVTPEGIITGLTEGETILMVRASDNPVLLYEVRILVAQAETKTQDSELPEAA